MSRRCNDLRQKALCGGFDSRAAHAWRIHCRSCPDCRTELYLLATLQRQAQNERRHLPRREVAELLEQARNRFPRKPRMASAWTWTFRFACFAVMFLLVAHMQRRSAWNSEHAQASALPDEAPSASQTNVAQLHASGGAPGKQQLAAGPAAESLPVSPLEETFDERLRQMRLRIDSRRDEILELLDRDLGEGGSDDAWNASLWSIAELA